MSEGEVAVATIVAGAVSGGLASILTLLYNSAQDRRDRHREHFSRALQSVSQYEEFPYIVRRRNAAQPEAERIRISTELRAVQAELSYHATWIITESERVGAAYGELVKELRKVAGGLMHDAWKTNPIDSDAAMNIPDIGPALAALAPRKQRYLREAMDHVSVWPAWSLRFTRWARSLPARLRKPVNED
jgi:hypothetical protein